MNSTPNLSVKIGTLELANPVMAASGTFGYGREFSELVELNRLGAIVVKGISLRPSPGNPPPRIVETRCGMLNAIGLENVGLDIFIREKLPFLSKLPGATIVNIYGTRVEEYGLLAEKLDECPEIGAIEVNISCPNVKAGGVAFGVAPEAAWEVVQAVRAATKRPLIVKLSPNVTDIVAIAQAAVEGGADALSLINTITAMAVDSVTRRPRLANITGGLSGPAIKPVALRMVWQVAQAVSVPVIGIGGIMNTDDALEFLIAGATAVQVGTANFVNPRATTEILDGIRDYLLDHRMGSVQELIGSLQIS
jgi:dihydroorotate dehydrogenase (NAD+) catalytic subunit